MIFPEVETKDKCPKRNNKTINSPTSVFFLQEITRARWPGRCTCTLFRSAGEYSQPPAPPFSPCPSASFRSFFPFIFPLLSHLPSPSRVGTAPAQTGDRHGGRVHMSGPCLISLLAAPPPNQSHSNIPSFRARYNEATPTPRGWSRVSQRQSSRASGHDSCLSQGATQKPCKCERTESLEPKLQQTKLWPGQAAHVGAGEL